MNAHAEQAGPNATGTDGPVERLPVPSGGYSMTIADQLGRVSLLKSKVPLALWCIARSDPNTTMAR